MKIDVNVAEKKEKLKKAVPLIKGYAACRGRHGDQLFPDDNPHNKAYRNAISAIIRNDRLERSSIRSSYCYASLFERVGEKTDFILLQVQPTPTDLDKDAYHHYIEWVINYSPWRHCFISKNINRILKDGVVVLDPTDKYLAKEAAIALRMAWENYYWSGKYKEIGLWWDVTQKVDPKMAFIAAKLMFKPKDANLEMVTPKSSDTGHTPINYSKDDDNDHLDGWYKESWVPRDGNWAEIDTYNITSKVDEIVSQIGKTNVMVNPFAPRMAKEYKREAFVEAMHSELPKLVESIHV